MLKFSFFITVIHIAFMVLSEIMILFRNLAFKIIWGKSRYEKYINWEKGRALKFKKRGQYPLPHNLLINSEVHFPSGAINSKKIVILTTLIFSFILIIFQAYLMARFTLFYHHFSGFQILPLIFITSIISVIFHLSARHGFLMVFVLLSFYYLFGVLIYQ